MSNEVTGLSSHRARVDKSVEELKTLEGNVLNCGRVTNNMAEEIQQIGLNFEDAEKRPRGVEAIAERHLFPSLCIGYTIWSNLLFCQHPQGKLERQRCRQRR